MLCIVGLSNIARCYRRRGFTLIELLVVIGIVSVLLALSILGFLSALDCLYYLR